MSNALSHREMYKTRTPPWKETYRKRCLERLRGSRDKLHARFRKIHESDTPPEDSDNSFIKDLMTEEWKSLQRDKASGISNELKDLDFDVDLDEIDGMLNLFEDIQEELRKEESKLLDEYERYEHSLLYEEAALCSAIETLSTEEVICPVCQRNPLMHNKAVLFCKCGLRINTEQDCINLSDVKHQLNEGISLHAASCDKNPLFSAITNFGTTNLLMTCQICDFMFVVV